MNSPVKRELKYPRYYEIDGDIYVMLFKKDGKVQGVNHYGVPYEPFMAVYNGCSITKEEYFEGMFRRLGIK